MPLKPFFDVILYELNIYFKSNPHKYPRLCFNGNLAGSELHVFLGLVSLGGTSRDYISIINAVCFSGFSAPIFFGCRHDIFMSDFLLRIFLTFALVFGTIINHQLI